MNTLKSEFAHLLFLEGYVLNMTRDTVHDATLDTHSDLSVAPLLFSTSTSNDNKSNSKNDILIHTSSSGGTIEDGSHNKKRTPWQSIAYKIDQFARNDKSVWFTGLQSDDNVEALICRTVEVADHYFMYHERSEFAKLMIRCHDMDFRYHCNRPASSHSQSVSTDVGSNISRPPLCTLENCIFAPYNCVNQDCPVAISRKWREKHDLSCMNKAVSCQRSCGDKVMRKLTHIHLATECRLRPVKCPFNDIGCNEGMPISTHV